MSTLCHDRSHSRIVYDAGRSDVPNRIDGIVVPIEMSATEIISVSARHGLTESHFELTYRAVAKSRQVPHLVLTINPSDPPSAPSTIEN